MQNLRYIFMLAVAFSSPSITSCSKDDNSTNTGGDTIQGKILYEFGTNTFQFDLESGTKQNFFEYNSYSMNGWDVSRDGKLLLSSQIIAGSFDVTKYTLSNLEDGSLIGEFEYRPLGMERDNRGLLSPDNSLIAIKPTADQGIIIVNTSGEVLHELNSVNGEPIKQRENVVWLPGNALVFTFNDFVLRTDPPYTTITPIRQMDFTEWGDLHANPDGTKLSMRIDKHIYLMDIDGQNLTQVTESSTVHYEREAVFSPDGKYLLVGTDWTPRSNSKGVWSLKIIPADGRKYRVDEEDPNVIPIIPKGSEVIEKCSDIMLWR
ncbi:hypothetical protein [Olivibacter sitiensis]|uniref:hypothetical protein n=1 Tax=Olivibacter sitiensis TaxID=376470 RepID=UPI000481EC0E|nr:hypothetical protein [Olivibacter sitiensis]